MHLSLRLAFARTDCTPMTHCVPMGRNSCGFKVSLGAGNVTRTHDLLITNQLLYRLSYTSICDGYFIT